MQITEEQIEQIKRDAIEAHELRQYQRETTEMLFECAKRLERMNNKAAKAAKGTDVFNDIHKRMAHGCSIYGTPIRAILRELHDMTGNVMVEEAMSKMFKAERMD